VCTVVCRQSTDDRFPVQILALRDELVSRAFDLPDAWWPEQPRVVGGRDRRAGGSWCVSDVDTGVTAVVLNRPERRFADGGAPSRGALPLAAVEHGSGWPDRVDVRGMASFNLVLAEPAGLRLWSFDGDELVAQDLASGTHLVTPLGRNAGLDARFERAGADQDQALSAPVDQVWGDWLSVLREATPGPDPAGLLVRRAVDGDSFETVFGQFIAARPGTLRLDYVRDPGAGDPWTTRSWGVDSAVS
jgi:hypothetical protein